MLIDKKDTDILEVYLYLIERLEKDINVTERAIRIRLENLNYIFQRKKLELELKIEKNKVILKDKNRKRKNVIEEFELENYNFNKCERMEIITERVNEITNGEGVGIAVRKTSMEAVMRIIRLQQNLIEDFHKKTKCDMLAVSIGNLNDLEQKKLNFQLYKTNKRKNRFDTWRIRNNRRRFTIFKRLQNSKNKFFI